MEHVPFQHEDGKACRADGQDWPCRTERERRLTPVMPRYDPLEADWQRTLDEDEWETRKAEMDAAQVADRG
jgi:hypothetical protein